MVVDADGRTDGPCGEGLPLACNRIPYQWLNPEQHPEALPLLKEKGIDDSKLPVVVFGDGTALVQPTTVELAHKVGIPTQAQQKFYDVVVVGAGPAGLAASVYGASEGLRTLVVEPNAPGGQAGSSSKIENYLGFPSGLSGEELAKRAFLQATRLGAEFLLQQVNSIRSENQYQIVQMKDGQEVTCHVCLIAIGVSYCKLDVPGIERLTGARRVLWRCTNRGQWAARARRCISSAGRTQRDRLRCTSRAMPPRFICWCAETR